MAALLGAVLLAAAAPSSLSAATVFANWYPRVAIVWPHDAAGQPSSAADSTAVNVSLWPTVTVNCTSIAGPFAAPTLWVAVNNEPLEEYTTSGQLIERDIGGTVFPSMEFNNLPFDLAAHPADRYTIMAGTTLDPTSNVWVHAVDPRTYYPQPVVPTGYGTPRGGFLDTRIQVVFPHDGQGRPAPVSQATFVNIAADLFIHGTSLSVPPDFEPVDYTLEEARGNSALSSQLEGLTSLGVQKTYYTVNGAAYPRWVWNNVPVQPGLQYHFAAFVYYGKLGSPYSTVWTHAADARTSLASPVPPPACAP